MSKRTSEDTLDNNFSDLFKRTCRTPSSSQHVQIQSSVPHSMQTKEMQMFQGIRVRVSQLPLLQQLFAKHEGFANSCIYKTETLRSGCIDLIIQIIELFKNRTAKTITVGELEFLRGGLADLEGAGFKVEWLRARFNRLEENSRRYHELMKKFRELQKKVGGIMQELETFDQETKVKAEDEEI